MVSVCIATYNGEKFIRQQLESILPQLSQEDEVIVSDDGSIDDTVAIIESIKDSRINIFRNGFRNVVKNFEFTLNKAKGEIIFLSDQDDIWEQNKVEAILNVFRDKSEVSLVLTNAKFISNNPEIHNQLFFKQEPPLNFPENIIRNHFLGCTMAFRNNIRDRIYPFPEGLAMHDWWIGLNHIRYGKTFFVNEPLIKYRRHENTVTTGKRASIMKGLTWRMSILKNIFLK